MSAIIEICWGEVVWRKVDSNWFFRPRPVTTTNGVPDRTIQAKAQDAALSLAARLAGLPIKDNFYEQYPHNKDPRLTKEQRDVRENLTEPAREETRAAIQMKEQEEEERQSRLESKRKEQRRQIRQILQELKKDQEKEAQEPPVGNAEENTDIVSES
ncbi:uncharacterized protein NFIA_075040 [Aspergillus fischeri NRRL 181]|uniref:Uncharacterized protein n=1 Tax=Neosartorya fischeri (strain ATCC 1020 / DSM 3700 / CBS 544.65 / FGSC A1164 / JCM 1740 / NRRL 181 / WB 181) TaxID=331117 RepID=A1DDX1_NEOFI|nr:uncharacterized protein NFIA_075040 [Aspergillus fischeri NRRL 181]EAW17578.1 hypothetical protein NFIA_075040 [Aspergillus fischeri NRRL 181]KAG2025541.1 hypothetical protein GB937_002797 [Aspergillus fischeri]